MARPTLATRTRAALVGIAEQLDDRTTRVIVLGGTLALGLVLHATIGDPRVAWLAAPVSLIAGLAGGVGAALIVAGTASAGHLVIDLVAGLSAGEVLGLAIRTVVLPGLALVGTAGQHVERQRDTAMHRVVNEDPVTGLLNVRAFYDELQRLRGEQDPFTILLADIRGMRALNERYGHPTGTEAMRALAHVLRRSTGPGALASRLGSDEVAVALVGEDRARAREVVDAVVARLKDEQVSLPGGERFEVHAAYGVARYPEDGEDEVAVLRAADRAKERAKAAGLDHVALASGEEP
jgi:diguanylate cyclase (GGDEF)-like protein